MNDAAFGGFILTLWLSTGWQLASVMAPTEAQRVWADTVSNSNGQATRV